MIRVLTCFNITEDVDLLSESEWVSGSLCNFIDTGYLKKMFNCYDENALELACRYFDHCSKQEMKCALSAVTVSDKTGNSFLETLAAIGYTQTDRIALPEEQVSSLSSEDIAFLLYNYICKQEPFDLILTGTESNDGNQGKVPLLLTELLQIRCITQVTDFSPIDETRLSVSYYTDDAFCTETVPYPVLLVIGNTADAYLRVPTLKQRMQSKKQPITLYDSADFFAECNVRLHTDITLDSMKSNIQKRNPILVEQGDSYEKAATMYTYFKEWMKE